MRDKIPARLALNLALACLVLSDSDLSSQEDRDIGDPPPAIIPYDEPPKAVDTTGGSPNSIRGTFPEPPVLGERHLWQELQGYAKGSAVHPYISLFSQRLAKVVKSHGASGHKIDRIVVTGYADGIVNFGIRRDIGKVPAKCLASVTTPIDDQELALLRGCAILDQLFIDIGPTAGGISWEGSEYDEPDGGNKGDPYRKVRVDVYLRREP